jgi:aromatic ring-opening dioxygenase LigB subunit
MGEIVLGVVAPHGSIAVAEACTEEELAAAAATRAAFEELGRRCSAAHPQAVVVVTPHNVHVEGAIAVVVAARLEGAVSGSEGRTITLECDAERALSGLVLDALEEFGVPAVAVSFGGNRPEEAVMPMDWGTLIPLWHLGGRFDPPLPAVVISPARDLSPGTHVDAGRAIAVAVERSGARAVLVASADHGHRHRTDGPYGYDPASAEYDAAVSALVAESRLAGLLTLDPGFVEQAAADSWWQLLVLHGGLGDAYSAELLSYEAPSYYGMLCASFSPA